ncbi:MAG: hypothetical protein M3165_07230 [Actinomycetota bacterium]|nr:hypothetical protein [Actinomycetota bacterium]
MSRRVRLAGADELFRRTEVREEEPQRSRPPLAAAPAPVEAAEPAAAPEEPAPDRSRSAGPAGSRRTASGRVRHDEKMTVYVTADELLEIEHARLVLRRTVGSAVDRGRLVRAAVAMALADLDEHGDDSELVRRLSES